MVPRSTVALRLLPRPLRHTKGCLRAYSHLLYVFAPKARGSIIQTNGRIPNIGVLRRFSSRGSPTSGSRTTKSEEKKNDESIQQSPPAHGEGGSRSRSPATSSTDTPSSLLSDESTDAPSFMLHVRAILAALRIQDTFSEKICSKIDERMLNDTLLSRFEITKFEGVGQKSLHWKTKPKETAYFEVYRRMAFFGLHAWLLHNRQHTLQPMVPLHISALLTFLDRQVLHWLWVSARLWIAEADVPPMSIENELKEFQHQIFDIFLALDDVLQRDGHRTLTVDELNGLNIPVKEVILKHIYQDEPANEALAADLASYVLLHVEQLQNIPWHNFVESEFRFS